MDIFRKYCRIIFNNPDANNLLQLQKRIESHPNKVTDPILVDQTFSGVQVDVKYKDANELNVLQQQIVGYFQNTTIGSSTPYKAFLPTQAREQVLNSIKRALVIYGGAVAATLGAQYSKIQTNLQIHQQDYIPLFINAILLSMIPAFVAYFKKNADGS